MTTAILLTCFVLVTAQFGGGPPDVSGLKLSTMQSERWRTAANKTLHGPETRDTVACSAASRPRVMTSSSGSFESTNYPGNYPNNQLCQWLIQVQPGNIVSLDFSVIWTEPINDYVDIFDGNSDQAAVITRFDGDWRQKPPQNVLSTGNSMFVEFVSNDHTAHEGFLATYTSVPPTLSPDPCYPLSRPQLLTSYSGTFISRNYPNDYWNYADCQWLIESQEPGGTVQLSLNFFNTEANYDYLYLYDGSTQNEPLIARIHGNYGSTPPGPYRSTQQYMFALFVSDNSYTYEGFSASYTSLPGPSTTPTTTTTTSTTTTTPPPTTETTEEPTTTSEETTTEPTTTLPTTTRPSTTTLYPPGPCGTIMSQAPNGTLILPGFDRMCYISTTDTAYLATHCYDLVTNIPGVGSAEDLLAKGGNFGCSTTHSTGYEDAPYACFDNYQWNLELIYCSMCHKLFVCIRFD